MNVTYSVGLVVPNIRVWVVQFVPKLPGVTSHHSKVAPVDTLHIMSLHIHLVELNLLGLGPRGSMSSFFEDRWELYRSVGMREWG